MPTAPSHQGWAAIQSITATPSSVSPREAIPAITPSESPLPRMSTRRQA